MTTAGFPAQLRRDAEQMFRAPDVSASLEFFERLSLVNQRLFLVEFWEALSKVALSPSTNATEDLVELIERGRRTPAWTLPPSHHYHGEPQGGPSLDLA